MKIKMQSFKRTTYVAIAFILAVAGVAQGLLSQKAYAFPVGGQLIDREVTISSSTISATSVSYRVAFLPYTDNIAVKGVIVEFCDQSETPIIGDATCTGPTGFNIGTPTVDTSPGDTGYTDFDAVNTWTAAAPTTHTLKLTSATAATLDAQNATRYAFTISGVTNPSDLGTFYARIILYTGDPTTGDIASYAPGTEGSTDATDYGGIALSTNYVINIKAKVQETLVFCVSGTVAIGNGCSTNVTQPNLTLGHGTNNILDNTATDTMNAYMQASTNAQSGINVRMKNSNACGGLSRDGGTVCDIAAAGATAVGIPAGTSALFGMYVTPGSGVTAAAPYNGGTTTYGMDTTAGSGVTSTYGSLIASSTTPLSNIESSMTFAATATVTTPAGLYEADMTIICTGTF